MGWERFILGILTFLAMALGAIKLILRVKNDDTRRRMESLNKRNDGSSD